MPPKKKNSPAVSGPSTQTNKRTVESLLPVLAKRRKCAEDAGPNEERIMDSYCWLCHQPGKDIGCKDCPRVYHIHCLNKASLEFRENKCYECQLKLLSRVNRSKFLTVETLREILSVAAVEFRKKFQTPEKHMFFQWPNIGDSEIVRVMDFDMLDDNIKDEKNPYKSLSEIMSDIKWIHHNYCILDGVDSSIAKEAESFVRMFQREISDIEDCPKCYHRMFVARKTDKFFTKICEPPHDIVWAWLKGSPPWPAKCLRVENGKAHVRFFGTHDKSNIPLGNKCLAISKTHPAHKNSKPKRKGYQEADKELTDYVNEYNEKFAKKFVYHEPGTPYMGEMIKSSRKKRNRNRRSNVSTVSNPEENVSLFTTDESVLNDSNVAGNQNGSSSQIEVVTMQEEDESVDRFIASGDTDDFRQENNLPIQNTSQVLSASMVCEVASNDDGQSINSCLAPAVYTGFNSRANLSRRNFQLHPLCSSTPLASTSNCSNQVDTLSVNRPENIPEELTRNVYSESQQMQSDDVHRVENIPFNIQTSVSETMDGDDDVIFLSSRRRPRNAILNPSAVLPYILNSSPDIKSLFTEGKQALDSLFLRLWAEANRMNHAPELIARIMLEMKKLTLENNKLKRENEEREQNNAINANQILQEKNEEINSLKRQISVLEEENQTAIDHANTIVQGMYEVYRKKFHDLDLGSSLEEKDMQLQEKNAEGQKKTLELLNARIKIEQYMAELRNKDEIITELSGSLELCRTQIAELQSKHEAGDAYTTKLEEVLKLLREKRSFETEHSVREIVNQQLTENGFIPVHKPSSSGAQLPEPNLPVVVPNHTSGSSKKSNQNISSKSQDPCHSRASVETVETDHHISQQMISQEGHVKTIAKKTSVIQLEHSKTITTTRNEEKMVFRPVNAAYDYNRHIAHRERYHSHSASNFLHAQHGRDKQSKDPRKKQSRHSHHDKQ